MTRILMILAAASLVFCTAAYAAGQGSGSAKYEKAILAGGCFWCMTPPFEKAPGVVSVVSGYTGGRTINPNYENYAEGGHIEAVEITYDPAKTSYSKLLDIFWKQIDPTDGGGQFVDRGPQYRSAIFYLNDAQKAEAERSRDEIARSGRFKGPIVTDILKAQAFYPAEEYHQNYHEKNPIRYKFYRYRSGRDQFLNRVWGEGGH